MESYPDSTSFFELDSDLAMTFGEDSGVSLVELNFASHFGQSGAGQENGAGIEHFPTGTGHLLSRDPSICTIKFERGINVPSAVTSVSAELGQCDVLEMESNWFCQSRMTDFGGFPQV